MSKQIEFPVRPEQYTSVFRQAVASRMQEQGLTATEVAEMAEVSRMSFNRYLRGERFPTQSTAKRIAAALLIDWADFQRLICTRERFGFSPPLTVKGVKRKTAKRKRFEQYTAEKVEAHKQAKIAVANGTMRREDIPELPLFPPDWYKGNLADAPRFLQHNDYSESIPQGGFRDDENIQEILKEFGWQKSGRSRTSATLL